MSAKTSNKITAELVCVVWKDHMADSENWIPIKALKKLTPAQVISAGFRLFENAQKIILVTSLSGAFSGGVLIIAKALVKKVIATGYTVEIDKNKAACDICQEIGALPTELHCPAVDKLEKNQKKKV